MAFSERLDHIDDENVSNDLKHLALTGIFSTEVDQRSSESDVRLVSLGDHVRGFQSTHTPTKYGFTLATAEAAPDGTRVSTPAAAILGSPNTYGESAQRESKI